MVARVLVPVLTWRENAITPPAPGDHQGPPRRSSPPSPLREGHFPRKDGDPTMFAVSRYTVGRVFRCVLLSLNALDVIQACFLAA